MDIEIFQIPLLHVMSVTPIIRIGVSWITPEENEVRVSRRSPRLVAMIAVGSFALAACGGGSGGDGAAAKASADALAAAKKTVAEASAPLNKLSVTEPLANKPAKIKVAFVETDCPACHVFADMFKEAAPVLGFDVTYINAGFAPNTASAAFDQAVKIKPDVVVQQGWPRPIFARQLKALKANGGQMVTEAIGEDGLTPKGVGANLYRPADAKRYGEIIADYGVVATHGAPHVLIPYIPDFVVSTISMKATKARTKLRCPACVVTALAIKSSDLGTKAPQQIASALQRDPKVNYLAPTWSPIFTGVPAALKTAGITRDIKVGTTAGSTVIYNDILNGNADMVIAAPNTWLGWQLADATARVAAGQKVDYASVYDGFDFPNQLLTKKSITFDTKSEWDGWDGFKAAFTSLWSAS